MKSKIITFGKYKGYPVEVLVNDTKYMDWLLSQEWFRNGKPDLYTFIINSFIEPSNTPEHNRMQADFLNAEKKEDVVSRLYIRPEVLVKKYEDKIKQYQQRINDINDNLIQSSQQLDEFEKQEVLLDELIRSNRKNVELDDCKLPKTYEKEKEDYSNKQKRNEIISKIQDIKRNKKTAEEEMKCISERIIRYSKTKDILERKGYDIKTEFEVCGWDVYMNLGCPYNTDIFCELKPSIGDDYPTVLREMKERRGVAERKRSKYSDSFARIDADYVLIYKDLNTTTVTEKELKQYFELCGFKVIRLI